MAEMEKGYRAHLVKSFLGGAVLNAALQLLAAYFLVNGFTIDWYVHPPQAVFTQEDVLKDAFVSALMVGSVAAAIAVGLTYRAWDKGHLRVHEEAWDGGSRTRDGHAALVATYLGVGLAVFVAVNLLVLFTAYRDTDLSADAFYMLKALLGAFAGGLASWIGASLTARGIASGRVVKSPPGENLIALISLNSSRKPGRVVGAVLVVTLLMSAGVFQIDTNVDVADVLPRGDPNTEAAHNLTDEFKSSFTQQVTFHFRANPSAWEGENAKWLPNRQSEEMPDNITDELYLRAMEQAISFILDQEPFRHSVAISDLYSLINWTLAGGQDAPDSAYRLPPPSPDGSVQYVSVEEGVRNSVVFSSVDALTSPDWRQTSVLILVDAHEPLTGKEIGERALEVRDEYVQWVEDNPEEAYQVFGSDNPPIFTVDLPIANAHSSELTQEDFKLLLPFIAYFIVICLFVAFRHPSYILVTFSSLAISVIWTFGAMGYMGIAMNTLNLTTVPLIMGVGIDYGIHIMNEYQASVSKGMSSEEAFRHAGGHGAFALFIATLTTSIGLAVMMISPSLLIAQLGMLSIIAIVSVFLLSITFIPAAITMSGVRAKSSKKYKRSTFVPAVARHVGRFRGVYAVVLVLLTVGAYASASTIHNEEFGDPARNYLPDDPVRQEHEKALLGFYNVDEPDVKANVLVFEGNVTGPAAHAWMDGIEASLKTKELVIQDTLRTVPFLLRTWLTVKDGADGAAEFILLDQLHRSSGNDQADPYPDSRAEVERELEALHQTPLTSLGSMFTNHPDNDMAIMIFSVRADSYEEAEEVWRQVWEAIEENEELKPDDVQVAFVGNTATNYLFVAKEVPWLAYMSIAVNLAVFFLVLASTRNWRLATMVGVATFTTSVFWLGALPPMGIGLAITLTLPLVFIFAMGSDYVLHLGLACEHQRRIGGDMNEAYATYGKGVFFSFVTTLGAFAIFTRISNVAVRETMIATGAAIVMIFLVTLLLVPIFYPPGKAAPQPEAATTGDPASPTPRPRVRVVDADAGRGAGGAD